MVTVHHHYICEGTPRTTGPCRFAQLMAKDFPWEMWTPCSQCSPAQRYLDHHVHHFDHIYASPNNCYFQPFTYAVCLNELGNEIVHQYVGQVRSRNLISDTVVTPEVLVPNSSLTFRFVHSPVVLRGTCCLFREQRRTKSRKIYEMFYNSDCLFRQLRRLLSIAFLDNSFHG